MAFLLPLLIGLGAGTGLSVVANPMNVAINRLLPVLPMNPNQLVIAKFRNQITEEKYFDEMQSNGFNVENSTLISIGQEQLLAAQENLNLFRRKKLGATDAENKEKFFELMRQIGFIDDTIDKFVTSQDVINSSQQLILFLVREVLDPKLRLELELDQEFPEASIADFAKIGIQEELARRIWAAHWELPDVAAMQTAMHRYAPQNRSFWEKEIVQQGLNPDKVQTSISDISQLLKFKDVGTRYREQVLSTLFNDVGQIQLRWLIRFGFLDYNQAVYRHERQGLPRTVAEQVTKVVFVVQSITDWKTAISKGAMTFDDVVIRLAEWQITEENIINIVRLKVGGEIADGVSDERDLTKGLIRDSWELGQIARSEVLTELILLGYDDNQTKFIFEVWEAELEIKRLKESKRGKLTTAEVKKAFRAGKFTQAEAVDLLVANGRQSQAAEIIIQIEADALAK